jgi:ABC-type multidrug transport system fused ATPase/permease subunit
LGLKSAQAFFSKMFNSILRSPMSFFDTTPSGRILSRVNISYDLFGYSMNFPICLSYLYVTNLAKLIFLVPSFKLNKC